MEIDADQIVDGASSGDAQPQTERVFSIGDIAREFSVSLRALRFYEDRGLLHPHRRGTTRLYSERDRSRLQMILKGKQLGFTLSEIREMLSTRNDAMNGWDLELNLHPDQITSQIRHLERQRAELETALAELREAHQRAGRAHDALNAA